MNVIVASCESCRARTRWKEVLQVDQVFGESGGAAVDSRNLEQIEHHLLEHRDLGGEHRERLDDLRWELLVPPLDDLQCGRQRRQRGAELVAHVGREPSFAVDALFERARHCVERVGETPQVRVVDVSEARVQRTVGDPLGSVGDRDQWLHQSSRRRSADQGRGEGRAEDPECEGSSEQVQGAVELVEGEQLEVRRPGNGDGHAGGEAEPPTGVPVALMGGMAVADNLDEVLGERVRRRRERRREPLAPVSQDRVRRCASAEAGQKTTDVRVCRAEHGAGQAGIHVGLLLGCVLPLVDEVAASHGVRHGGQDD